VLRAQWKTDRHNGITVESSDRSLCLNILHSPHTDRANQTVHTNWHRSADPHNPAPYQHPESSCLRWIHGTAGRENRTGTSFRSGSPHCVKSVTSLSKPLRRWSAWASRRSSAMKRALRSPPWTQSENWPRRCASAPMICSLAEPRGDQIRTFGFSSRPFRTSVPKRRKWSGPYWKDCC
jgi:hypothetical protein